MGGEECPRGVVLVLRPVEVEVVVFLKEVKMGELEGGFEVAEFFRFTECS